MDQSDEWFFKAAFNSFLFIIMVPGVIGNVVVIVVILKVKGMHNSTNILLGNLAIADLMTLLIWGIDALFDINSGENLIDLSPETCYAESFIVDLVLYASVLTILVVSFERYYAVCEPLKAGYICTANRAYKSCLLVWVFAALSSSPQLFCYNYEEGSDISGTHLEPVCWQVEDFCFCKNYYIITSLIFFFLPLTILIVTFSKIAQHLNVTTSPNVNIAANRSRRQVVTMLTTVVVCFFVFQLPYRAAILLAVTVLDTEDPWLGDKEFLKVAYFSLVMIYLNAAVNPILYNVMSEKFMGGLKSVCRDILHGFSKLRWSRGHREDADTATELMNTLSNGSARRPEISTK